MATLSRNPKSILPQTGRCVLCSWVGTDKYLDTVLSIKRVQGSCPDASSACERESGLGQTVLCVLRVML